MVVWVGRAELEHITRPDALPDRKARMLQEYSAGMTDVSGKLTVFSLLIESSLMCGWWCVVQSTRDVRVLRSGHTVGYSVVIAVDKVRNRKFYMVSLFPLLSCLEDELTELSYSNIGRHNGQTRRTSGWQIGAENGGRNGKIWLDMPIFVPVL